MSSNQLDGAELVNRHNEHHQTSTDVVPTVMDATEDLLVPTAEPVAGSSPRSETAIPQADVMDAKLHTSGVPNNAANSEIPEKPSLLKADEREKISDRWIDVELKTVENDQDTFHRKVLTRVSAKNVIFKNVSFFQTIFDTCYFNHCVFDSCNFTGCRFISCNLNQSTFPGCKFEYAIFERSQIDDDILNAAPERNNLKLKFARTLRMNYQQIGDAKAVNRAIVVELEATEIFLKESWSSNSDYHRKKYVGLSRVWQFFKWIEFRALDFIWGNGESVTKLLKSIIWVIFAVGLIDMIYSPDAKPFSGFLQSFFDAPALFLGVKPLPDVIPPLLSASIAALRLLGFAFLTAILVKRFGRR
ncbi:pentapeptide repeat-containing protein [Pseudomonas sp. ZY71]|uniref:pentapeptide repeat-containing protein n=1 Tax=Pseudomonas sp. ZY71 TaxID=3115647 RepID=UPI002F3FFF55